MMIQFPRILVNTTSIFLRWELPSIAMATPMARYLVQYKRLGVLPVDDQSSTNNITLTGLMPGTIYMVSITAIYDLGNAQSSPVSVNVKTNAEGTAS